MRRFLALAATVALLGCPSTDDTGLEAVDADGDGYLPAVDCNDEDPAVHPGAEEVCDETDNDCDGLVDTGSTDATPYYPDLDGDGYGAGEVAFPTTLSPAATRPPTQRPATWPGPAVTPGFPRTTTTTARTTATSASAARGSVVVLPTAGAAAATPTTRSETSSRTGASTTIRGPTTRRVSGFAS